MKDKLTISQWERVINALKPLVDAKVDDSAGEEVYVECEPHEAIGNFHSLTMEGLKHDLTPLKRTTLSLPTEEEIIEKASQLFIPHYWQCSPKARKDMQQGFAKTILTLLKEKR